MFFHGCPEAVVELRLIRFRQHDVITMRSAESDICIGIHLTPAAELPPLEINEAVGSGIIVSESAMSVNSLRLKVFVVNLLYPGIKNVAIYG